MILFYADNLTFDCTCDLFDLKYSDKDLVYLNHAIHNANDVPILGKLYKHSRPRFKSYIKDRNIQIQCSNVTPDDIRRYSFLDFKLIELIKGSIQYPSYNSGDAFYIGRSMIHNLLIEYANTGFKNTSLYDKYMSLKRAYQNEVLIKKRTAGEDALYIDQVIQTSMPFCINVETLNRNSSFILGYILSKLFKFMKTISDNEESISANSILKMVEYYNVESEFIQHIRYKPCSDRYIFTKINFDDVDSSLYLILRSIEKFVDLNFGFIYKKYTNKIYKFIRRLKALIMGSRSQIDIFKISALDKNRVWEYIFPNYITMSTFYNLNRIRKIAHNNTYYKTKSINHHSSLYEFNIHMSNNTSVFKSHVELRDNINGEIAFKYNDKYVSQHKIKTSYIYDYTIHENSIKRLILFRNPTPNCIDIFKDNDKSSMYFKQTVLDTIQLKQEYIVI